MCARRAIASSAWRARSLWPGTSCWCLRSLTGTTRRTTCWPRRAPLLAHQEKAFVAVQRAGVCDLRTENAASAVCDLGRIPLGGVAVWKRRWARLRKPKYGLELPFLFAGIALAHDARLPAVSADESFLQEGLFGELEPVVREMHARVQSRK